MPPLSVEVLKPSEDGPKWTEILKVAPGYTDAGISHTDSEAGEGILVFTCAKDDSTSTISFSGGSTESGEKPLVRLNSTESYSFYRSGEKGRNDSKGIRFTHKTDKNRKSN
jgi:hypothetical protein